MLSSVESECVGDSKASLFLSISAPKNGRSRRVPDFMRSVFSWLRCHQNPKTEISTSAEFNRLYALARAPIFLAFESLNAIGKHVEKKANIVGHSVSRVGRPQTFGILLMDKILRHQG